jgi:hypothetical protein
MRSHTNINKVLNEQPPEIRRPNRHHYYRVDGYSSRTLRQDGEETGLGRLGSVINLNPLELIKVVTDTPIVGLYTMLLRC